MSKESIQAIGGRKVTGVTLAILGVLALATLIVYIAMFRVSKVDYTHALERTNSAASGYNVMQAALTSYGAAAQDSTVTDAKLSEKSKAFTDALAAYQSAAKAIAAERALKDQSIQSAYDTFAAKSSDYTSKLAQFTELLPVLHSKSVDCSKSALGRMDTGDLGKLTEVYDAVATPCVKVMQKLADSHDETAKTAGKKGLEYFSDMRKHIVAMQDAYTAGNRTTFESEYKAFLASANNFDIGTDTSKVASIERLGTPADALNTLAKTLQSKAK